MKLMYQVGLLSLLVVAFVRAEEDEAEGEDGVQFEDNTIYRAVVESCAGWRLNKLPEVKSFIYGDFEAKFERTQFKKIPGKAPEIIFFNQGGKEIERINIEKMTRDELNQLLATKGYPSQEWTRRSLILSYYSSLNYPKQTFIILTK